MSSYAQASVHHIRIKHIFGKYKKTTNGEKTKKNMIVPFQNIQTLGKMLKKNFFKLEINFSILKGILKINNLNF